MCVSSVLSLSEIAHASTKIPSSSCCLCSVTVLKKCRVTAIIFSRKFLSWCATTAYVDRYSSDHALNYNGGSRQQSLSMCPIFRSLLSNHKFQKLIQFSLLQQLPTHIHGDLDSLRPDVRTFYANHGVKVTQDPDQYSTDFGKAMKKGAEALIEMRKLGAGTRRRSAASDVVSSKEEAETEVEQEREEAKEAREEKLVVEVNGKDGTNHVVHQGNVVSNQEQDIEILILGSLAGRVYHAIGLLHEMLREQRPETSTFVKAYSELISVPTSSSSSLPRPQFSTTQSTEQATPQQPQSKPHQGPPVPTPTLTLLSPSSLTFLLPPNSINTIKHDPFLIGPTVGILPVYGPVLITTHGLEWDVAGWETRMGGMVSTSNRFAQGARECVVEVRSVGGGNEEEEGREGDGKGKGNWVVFTVERVRSEEMGDGGGVGE